ncbi:MAG: plasma-membrane proton-efflux P-type ATPase [Rectinema subterraneum]
MAQAVQPSTGAFSDSTEAFKTLSLEETLAKLNASADGLASSEASARLARLGLNAIEEKKAHPLAQYLSRYWGPMPWLLEIAIVLAAFLGHVTESVIIFLLLSINAVIGFMHQRNTSKALELLKKRLAVNARVLRDRNWQTIDAIKLVPGDIILVKLGDIVPADVKIVRGNLSVDESSLTGESLPAERSENSIVYSSSIARQGEATCLVLNTGGNTFFGKTASLVKIAKPVSHQEEVMLTIVRYMMYLGIVSSFAVGIYALVLHIPFLMILSFIVTFLIGAVPVALPAVLTIVQAAAGSQMAEKGALVTRLDAIEDAASISVVCFDKTGTITQNKLSVVSSAASPGFSEDDILRIAALASSADNMDLIDSAILNAAASRGLATKGCAQLSFTPFSPATRRTEAVIECAGSRYHVLKGAVPIILELCSATSESARSDINAQVALFAQKGYRTIAVARACEGAAPESPPELIGILALADPIRSDSRAMIADLRALNVKPIMLTGDSLAIAREISVQAGIGPNIISIKELDGMDEGAQARKVAQIDGFAEIFPEDKYRIVKLLQKSGYIVGMTGDGVNDAPALKQAEMGIAVSNAADVAKASASVVLTQEGVGVIVQAIRLSRRTYQRMLTWVINKVTKVVQVLGLLVAGFFLFRNMILSMLDMSLLVFANDFVTMSLATDNAKDAQAPNQWKVKNITLASLAIGLLLAAQGIGGIFIGQDLLRLDFGHMQTFVLLTLIFTSQFRVLIVRERRCFWDSMPGTLLLVSTGSTMAIFFLMGAFGFIIPALGARETALALAYSLVFTAMLDCPKRLFFRLFHVD